MAPKKREKTLASAVSGTRKANHTKKTVSAASVFRRQARKSEEIAPSGLANAEVPKEKKDVDVAANSSADKSRSSPRKSDGRVTQRKSNMHPLAIEFNNSSKSYRRYLWDLAHNQINKTLATLLGRLYKSTLQIASPAKPHPATGSSPLQLTAPAKYERMALKVYQPLSLYTLNYSTTDTNGKHAIHSTTLNARMEAYSEHLATRIEYVKRLQKEWERVVGEIWKLGIAILNADTMQKLLVTPAPSSSSLIADAESTLFVPEHASPLPASKVSKMRIASNVPKDHSCIQLPNLPAFMCQPSSRERKKSVPTTPEVAPGDVRDLVKRIEDLGKTQVEEMENIAKEHAAYWKKKNAMLAKVLRE